MELVSSAEMCSDKTVIVTAAESLQQHQLHADITHDYGRTWKKFHSSHITSIWIVNVNSLIMIKNIYIAYISDLLSPYNAVLSVPHPVLHPWLLAGAQSCGVDRR